jgi:hypothetical protein
MLRSRLTLPLLAAAGAAAVVPAYLAAHPSASSITVTLGAPKETSIKVTPSKATSSQVVFNVTNKGTLPHSFRVCKTPVTSTKANTCAGSATKPLKPGAKAMLTVTLPASGTYEYLSGTSSQAASGMKGLFTVALASTASGGAAPVSTTTSTTGKSSGGGASGGVVNGQATDPSCAPGTLVPVGPGTGDQDDDNEGGFPSDGDGCL